MAEHTGRKHDLGKEFEMAEYLDDNGELIGYTITGPAAPQCRNSFQGRCGGLCPIRPFSVPVGESQKDYSVWEVSGEWPNITLAPSVACGCDGQHSFVQDGKWL